MKQLALLCFCLASSLVVAQTNYHKGSVTSTNGKTLLGYINYREWEETPKFIQFKESLEDIKSEMFYPATVKSFIIDGLEQYHTYAGKISMNATRFPDLAEGRDTTTKSVVVFFKLISEGQYLSLFSYTDSLKTRYFVQEKPNKPIELGYQEYYTETHEQTQKITLFVGQLIYLANKYAPTNTSLLNKIKRIHYESADIQAVIDGINGNQTKMPTNRLSNTRFFAGAGLDLNMTAFKGDNVFASAGKKTSYSPHASAGIDVFNNPSVQRFLLRLQLSVSYINPEITANYSSSSTSEKYKFSQYNVSFVPQLIWNIYNKDNFKLYLDGGAGINYSIYPTNQFVETGPYVNTMSPYNLEHYGSAFRFRQG